MKKVLFMAVAAAAISFASCTSNTNKGEANVADSINTPTVENAKEDVTTELQSKLEAKDAEGMLNVLKTINEKIKSLQEEGKLEEAKNLLIQAQDFLINNSEKVNSIIGDNETLNKMIEAVNGIPVEALGASTEALKDTKEGIKDAKEGIKDAANSVEKKTEEATDKAKKEADKKAKEALGKAAKGLGI
ncbi:hypothetical protein [Prevotella koreensis]